MKATGGFLHVDKQPHARREVRTRSREMLVSMNARLSPIGFDCQLQVSVDVFDILQSRRVHLGGSRTIQDVPFRKPLSLSLTAIAKHWWTTLQTAQRSWSAPQDSAISHAVKEAGNFGLCLLFFFANLQHKATQDTLTVHV